jgi:hypothetical protein
MEQTAVLAALLIAILAFLAPATQRLFQTALHRTPAWIVCAPLLFTAIFCGTAELVHVRSLPLILMVLAYTSAPVVCAYAQGPGPVARSSALDFLTILILWLPLEFAAGARLIPRPAQGFLHSVAYGIAILLALMIFLGFRAVPGMKFNLPRQTRDYWLPIAAFAITAPCSPSPALRSDSFHLRTLPFNPLAAWLPRPRLFSPALRCPKRSCSVLLSRTFSCSDSVHPRAPSSSLHLFSAAHTSITGPSRYPTGAT